MLQSYSFFSTLRVSASAFKRFLLILVIHRRVWHPCHTHAARHTHAACHNQAFGVRISPTNAIGRRTQSNRTPDAIQSDTERNPIGRRTQSDQVANASGDKNITYAHAKLNYFRGCTCLKCTKSITYTTKSITYAHAKLNRKALIVIKIDYNIAEV